MVERGPERPVYSNVTARPYEDSASRVSEQLGDHLASPVQFSTMIDAMYDDGARVFVEVGPGGVLTALVGSILGDRPHLALACDPPGKKGVAGLLATLGRLFTAGVAMDLLPLTARRSAGTLKMNGDRFESTEPKHSPATWFVNGNRAPAGRRDPEPSRVRTGPGSALPAAKVVATRRAQQWSYDRVAVQASDHERKTCRSPRERMELPRVRRGFRSVSGDDAKLPRGPAVDDARLPGDRREIGCRRVLHEKAVQRVDER